MERDWRDSNAPQWAKDAAEKEIAEWRLTAALSWPTEAKPVPMPFRWGDYDRLSGEPVPGRYWDARAETVEIKKQDGKFGGRYKAWAFKYSRGDWTTSVARGPLFDNERDARLWMLWKECEKCADKLSKLRAKL